MCILHENQYKRMLKNMFHKGDHIANDINERLFNDISVENKQKLANAE